MHLEPFYFELILVTLRILAFSWLPIIEMHSFGIFFFSRSLHLAMENRTNMDIVTVTGGSGFLGQHIVKMLQERTDYVSEIRVLDKVPHKNLLCTIFPCQVL